MRGRGSKTTDKVIKDIIEEANLNKHQQNVLGKILATLCKGKKTIVDKGSEDTNLPSASRESKLREVGCKPRMKKGCFALSKEERKEEG